MQAGRLYTVKDRQDKDVADEYSVNVLFYFVTGRQENESSCI